MACVENLKIGNAKRICYYIHSDFRLVKQNLRWNCGLTLHPSQVPRVANTSLQSIIFTTSSNWQNISLNSESMSWTACKTLVQSSLELWVTRHISLLESTLTNGKPQKFVCTLLNSIHLDFVVDFSLISHTSFTKFVVNVLHWESILGNWFRSIKPR